MVSNPRSPSLLLVLGSLGSCLGSLGVVGVRCQFCSWSLNVKIVGVPSRHSKRLTRHRTARLRILKSYPTPTLPNQTTTIRHTTQSTMSAIAPLSLFRSLIREARKVDNYNFREYAIRRVRIGFQINRNLAGSERDLAIREGQEHLEVLKRQVVLGRLYPSATSVMETAA
ncbi:hypothetical protein ACHAWO_000478 [Cyclotella atomus]|uniref:Complex 1 LYR protein domain-containing protein n=1 Tax=Cyclotella atomus TaxID=382360 RepID=A0ABD3PI13_9STRA